uniref:Uncharacterized protein n=1 Tax=Trichinella nativa TaxID=6335 RepID=A0A0V1KIJ4_9BILA
MGTLVCPGFPMQRRNKFCHTTLPTSFLKDKCTSQDQLNYAESI